MQKDVAKKRQEQHDKRMKQKSEEIDFAKGLKSKGYSNVAIANTLGTTESKIRTLLKPSSTERR